MLMIGPPGAGKTLLARSVPGILPRMSVEEALVVGELSLDGIVRHTRGVLPMAAVARA